MIPLSSIIHLFTGTSVSAIRSMLCGCRVLRLAGLKATVRDVKSSADFICQPSFTLCSISCLVCGTCSDLFWSLWSVSGLWSKFIVDSNCATDPDDKNWLWSNVIRRLQSLRRGGGRTRAHNFFLEWFTFSISLCSFCISCVLLNLYLLLLCSLLPPVPTVTDQIHKYLFSSLL